MRRLSPWARRFCLLVFLLVTRVSTSTAGPPASVHDLKGPAPQPGQAYRDESTFTLTGGRAVFTTAGRSETVRADIRGESIYEEQFLAVEADRVTRTRIRVLKERDVWTIGPSGSADPRPIHGSLEGATVEGTRAADGWKFQLVGKTPTAEQLADLRLFSCPLTAADWLPAGPVAPGRTWDVDPSRLEWRLGGAVRIDAGTWKITFDGMTTDAAGPCAVLSEKVQVRGTIRDDQGPPLRFELTATGSTRRLIDQAFNLSSRLTGTLTLSGSIQDEGQEGQLNIIGPFTVETRSRRIAELTPDPVALTAAHAPIQVADLHRSQPRPWWQDSRLWVVLAFAAACALVRKIFGDETTPRPDNPPSTPRVKPVGLGADGTDGVWLQEVPTWEHKPPQGST